MNSTAPEFAATRLPYADADSAEIMAADASLCQGEAHLARATATLATARRTLEEAPNSFLQAPHFIGKSTVQVTDNAADFAARWLD